MAKIEVFSGPACGYCERAKRLLSEKGVTFIELDVSVSENREEFIQRLPRSRSVPQIFIDDAHIGGFEDLDILSKSGKLDELLKKSD